MRPHDYQTADTAENSAGFCARVREAAELKEDFTLEETT